jgi:2,4-dienoyl-CoA reductase (NADPH2)
MIDHYRELARAGAALVIVANAAVSADGRISIHQLRADGDDFIPGLTRLAKAIKEENALACLQLNHAGRFADTDRPLLPAPLTTSNMAFNVSSLKDFINFFPLEKRFGLTRYFVRRINTWTSAMTAETIERVLLDFGDAAARAVEAGFDMIELHGAGGYLICQFLSPFTNGRPSPFGGTFGRRCAFPLAAIRHVAGRLPDAFPIGYRLMLREWVPGGIEPKEAETFARQIAKEGITYLSVSAASYHSMFTAPVARRMAKPAYLESDCRTLKRTAGVRTILGGRIVSPVTAERLLREGASDLIGLGRPLRVDPLWIQKAFSGRGQIRTCINCNVCLKRVVLNQGYNCSRWPERRQARSDLDLRLLGRNADCLVVAGSVEDLHLFRKFLSRMAPGRIRRWRTPSLTVVRTDDLALPSIKAFLAWAQGYFGVNAARVLTLGKEGSLTQESSYLSLIELVHRRNPGLVLFCRHRSQVPYWQRRFLYRIRGRVIGLLGPPRPESRIIAPVDLSESTLLSMVFLYRTGLTEGKDGTAFVHVSTGSALTAKKRWADLQAIANIDGDHPLRLLQPRQSVSDTLLALADASQSDTIVMGKRGLSGLKRWLLGSVSRDVLSGLGKRSLILVD